MLASVTVLSLYMMGMRTCCTRFTDDIVVLWPLQVATPSNLDHAGRGKSSPLVPMLFQPQLDERRNHARVPASQSPRLQHPHCCLTLFLCKPTNCSQVFHDNSVRKGSAHECNKRTSTNKRLCLCACIKSLIAFALAGKKKPCAVYVISSSSLWCCLSILSAPCPWNGVARRRPPRPMGPSRARTTAR